MARKSSPPDTPAKREAGQIGKRVGFDTETWQAIDLMARDRMMTFQEVADEAFRDVLVKHGRPFDVRDALKQSARMAQANENAQGKKNGRSKPAPKSKRPAKGRARS